MHILFSLLFLLYGAAMSAQVSLRNSSLTNPDAPILYQHLYNVLQLSGAPLQATIVSRHHTVEATAQPHIFLLRPRSLTPDTLQVYAGNQLLLQQVFTIATTNPDIVIQLGNIRKDTATLTEIAANKTLSATLRGGLYRHPLEIIGFSTTFTGPGHDAHHQFLTTQGNRLSAEQLDYIKQLPANSTIHIRDLMARDKDGKTRRLSGRSITIR